MNNSRQSVVETSALWPEDADEDQGVVINWFVSEGDKIKESETIGEIQIEKVSIDIVAPASGHLDKLHFEEEDEFKYGDILLRISQE